MHTINLLSEQYRRCPCDEGITVSHTPGAVDDATATTALYLIIATCRQFTRGEKLLRDGSWKSSFPSAHDPSSRTLGILGLGGIGLRTAELARAFPMKVVYHSRKPAANAPDWAEYCPELSDFLAKTDVLSVHIPLNEQTAGLIGANEIRTLKKGSIIVNTARGGVIDEGALIRALEDGHVSTHSRQSSLKPSAETRTALRRGPRRVRDRTKCRPQAIANAQRHTPTPPGNVNQGDTAWDGDQNTGESVCIPSRGEGQGHCSRDARMTCTQRRGTIQDLTAANRT